MVDDVVVGEGSVPVVCGARLEVGRGFVVCSLVCGHDGLHFDGFGVSWRF